MVDAAAMTNVIDMPARRSGKHEMMMVKLMGVIADGGRVAFFSMTPTGKPHVCTVTSIRRGRR